MFNGVGQTVILCFSKITEEQGKGSDNCILWPTQTYYSRLMSMLIQPPKLLQKWANLLRHLHIHMLWHVLCPAEPFDNRSSEAMMLQSWRKSTTLKS